MTRLCLRARPSRMVFFRRLMAIAFASCTFRMYREGVLPRIGWISTGRHQSAPAARKPPPLLGIHNGASAATRSGFATVSTGPSRICPTNPLCQLKSPRRSAFALGVSKSTISPLRPRHQKRTWKFRRSVWSLTMTLLSMNHLCLQRTRKISCLMWTRSPQTLCP